MVRVKAIYDSNDKDVPQVALGTGFFISKQGYVLTTTSIVYGPKRIYVEYKGISYAVRFVGVDPATNIALLQVINLPEDFDFIHLADSSGFPDPGTMILRISCPLDFDPTPTFGLVSGGESSVGRYFFPCVYIRTTVPVGLGDGGGALIDLNGRFIGMQTLSINGENSSYVIPARALLRVYYDLVSENKVSYVWCGFNVDPEPSIEQGLRFVVSVINEDSPAEKAGMQKDDVIVAVGGKEIRGMHGLGDLRNAFFYARVGEYVNVKVMRDGQPIDFNMKLVERPANALPIIMTRKNGDDSDVEVEEPEKRISEPPVNQDLGMDTPIPESALNPNN